MKEGGGGKIINLSGGGATTPRPFFSAYAVAKTGLVRFTEIIAKEVKEFKIEVNSIAPGILHTDMMQGIFHAGEKMAGQKEYSQAQKVMQGEGNDPRTAAELCVFLVSPSSDGITGRLISAIWDPWEDLPLHLDDLRNSDIYTLRRIVPKDRNLNWGDR
jgi:3-oxoacyl-[acyl-carrier protein] reductase